MSIARERRLRHNRQRRQQQPSVFVNVPKPSKPEGLNPWWTKFADRIAIVALITTIILAGVTLLRKDSEEQPREERSFVTAGLEP